MTDTSTFDYVIVGAGSAGCVLANRLSADGKHSVCVLEAGGKDTNPFVHIPAGFMKTLTDKSVNWLYSAEPSEWTGGRRIAAPRGKTLGGSSSINGHIYNRGQRADYDGWAQRGNRGWGYADILPYFKRTERKDGPGDDTFRGKSGSFVVTDTPWKHELCEAFIEGAVGMGIPRNPDYNGESQDGVGYFQRAIYKGRRMSAARAFLHPAMSRPNLQVITHAHATQILFEGKRAVGVEYAQGGARKRVSARREVILSGGVVNSPQLLQLSGIGDPEHLKRIGVEVRHALKGVGRNLRDHYAVRMVARVKNTWTINEKSRGLGLMGEALKYFTGQPSILGLCPSLVHCFWKSHPAVDGNDLQMTFTPASYKEGVQSQLDDFPAVTCAPWQQRPESSGHLLARSANPFEAPEIQPNYLADEMDRQVLLGGMRLARQLLQTPPMLRYFEREEFPGADAQSDDELLAFAKERGTTTFHLMGTCRMAPPTDPTAVVDDRLRVHGLEGLRVADASIMPMMLSANLNAATLMIGEKAADMILDKAAPDAVILPEAA
ncbi:MAG: GMC family oxidoreductase N-terminal domain-containing protein [Alphaproteobacteria bacterium]|nr:GMC family oxidoreductase N-terminal domain-containing protein [Alphaproteobacteria bacterium]MCB9929496.1 GMC family oxidoreductase N-terminal domain-containing protein [Alphaproteobacteria bacterium]